MEGISQRHEQGIEWENQRTECRIKRKRKELKVGEKWKKDIGEKWGDMGVRLERVDREIRGKKE